MPLPPGVRRGTAETLTGLINGARRKIRIAAPFVDDVGVGYLVGPLAAATARGVSIELIVSGASEWLDRALGALQDGMAREGDWSRVAVLKVTDPLPWPHLKVVTVDGVAAYVGSANITGPGLAGRNLELGVLVRGQQVSTIERTLDLIPVEGQAYSRV
jgi:phosphatidylserine/phosphatidylglycerophosphate/cardiolipin synthase-like enzyme